MKTTIPLGQLRNVLYSAVVCDALDAVGLVNQSPRCLLLPFGSQQPLIGRCKTTLWVDMYHSIPNPYELELRAVDTVQPDGVFIAAAGGSSRSAVWGELLSTAAVNRGCVGAIVDGLIRDDRRMRQMGFPVYARGTSPYDSKNRQRVVDLDVVVQIAGVSFAPGDLVIADRDGVVVVPHEVEHQVIQRAWDKVHTENAIRKAIQSGMSAEEAYEKYGTL